MTAHPSPPRGSRSGRPRSLTTSGIAAVALLSAVSLVPTAAAASAVPARAEADTASASEGLARLRAVRPVLECADLTSADLTGVTDAAVTIRSAVVRSEGAAAPYCAVGGTVAPNTTVVLRLPVEGWTQR